VIVPLVESFLSCLGVYPVGNYLCYLIFHFYSFFD